MYWGEARRQRYGVCSLPLNASCETLSAWQKGSPGDLSQDSAPSVTNTSTKALTSRTASTCLTPLGKQWGHGMKIQVSHLTLQQVLSFVSYQSVAQKRRRGKKVSPTCQPHTCSLLQATCILQVTHKGCLLFHQPQQIHRAWPSPPFICYQGKGSYPWSNADITPLQGNSRSPALGP